MSWIPPAIAFWEKISSSSNVLTWLYSRPYRGIIENEISLARINQDDTILNIGCGAVPFTALFLATLTGARVLAVDIDPRAAGLAEKCVQNSGLAHRIKVLQGDGSKPLGAEFTASLVALQAAPKNMILNVLKKTALPGARFIFRLPSPPYRDHYDNLTTPHPSRAQVRQPMRTFDRSVLYVNPA
jgi:hypothetical protein